MSRSLFLAAALALGGYSLQEPSAVKPSEPVKPTEFGAISYYEAKCARCHGPQGSFLVPGFAKEKDDAALTEVTKRMADGPGGAPLEDRDLKIEVAYMRAVSEGKPFLVWTKDGEKWEGESDVEKLKATVDGQAVEIAVKDGVWTLAKGKKMILEAGEGEKAVRLDSDLSNVSQSVERN
ncbi:cytochrome c [bacterium]|nr:MAG: cytochrome c [bacterium]